MIKNLLLALAGLVIIGFLYAFVIPALPQQSGGVACTAEAKLCPDGTAVGRTGPNCEFAECPAPKPVTFTCSGGKAFEATFDENYASVHFSDDTSVGLIRGDVESDGGEAVYGNSDGSLQLWVKDYSAFIQENGAETFSACVVDMLTFPGVN